MIKLPEDKLIHFLTCYVITFTCSSLLMQLMPSTNAAILISIPIALVIGVGKELYDKYIKKSFFDVYDLIADIIGIVSAILIIYAIQAIK